MDWMQVFLLIIALLYALYKFGTKNYDFWRRKGIRQTKPLPFVGNHAPLLLKSVDALQFVENLYYFSKEKILGIYLFMKPALLIRDPDLIKQILVKDADHFINRYDWTENSDELLGRALTLQKDEQWKNLRTVMSTVFTGAKMKDMFKFMRSCSEQSANSMKLKLQAQIKEKADDEDSNILEFEAKNYFSRYGTDVIASTAFGLEVDSFKNPNNEFYRVGTILRDSIMTFPIFKMMMIFMFPKLAKALKISFFGEKITNFFTNIVDETIRNREKNNIVRKDVIHVLMEARKGKGLNDDNVESYGKGKIPDLTNDDIAAQCILFFFGGFDIMASALGFICYELAVNPDVQEKLFEEINEIVEDESSITYDEVMFKMTYLDMIVKESLRKWPPAVVTDREVSKTYVLPKSEGVPDIVLKRGDLVLIPSIALQHDPKYFPNPDKFDPERFRDEKNTVNPFTYLPFGAGLRHCIAQRYAMMEMKIAIIHLVKTFFIVPTNRTSIPMKLSKTNNMVISPENGFWLGLKLRK